MNKVIRYSLTGVLCVLVVVLGSYATAQVYKSTDEQGNVTFSDTADANADEVHLSPPNTVKAVDIPTEPPTPTETAADDAYVVVVSSPANDSVIANGLVGFTVTTRISPKLASGHQLQLTIDGEVHSNSQGTFRVDSISRGPHSLRVALINDKGAMLAQSSPVNVFAYRPSIGGSK